jgi:hypothetical protein
MFPRAGRCDQASSRSIGTPGRNQWEPVVAITRYPQPAVSSWFFNLLMFPEATKRDCSLRGAPVRSRRDDEDELSPGNDAKPRAVTRQPPPSSFPTGKRDYCSVIRMAGKPTIEGVNLARIVISAQKRMVGSMVIYKPPSLRPGGDLMVAPGRTVPPISPHKHLTKNKKDGFGPFHRRRQNRKSTQQV